MGVEGEGRDGLFRKGAGIVWVGRRWYLSGTLVNVWMHSRRPKIMRVLDRRQIGVPLAQKLYNYL